MIHVKCSDKYFIDLLHAMWRYVMINNRNIEFTINMLSRSDLWSLYYRSTVEPINWQKTVNEYKKIID